MTINEYLQKTLTYDIISGRQRIRPRVFCADGYNVSVQAGEALYCNPRIDSASHYNSVELGFPSAEDELINDYAEDPGKYTETVYGWVPVEIVDALLEKHGGIINFD